MDLLDVVITTLGSALLAALTWALTKAATYASAKVKNAYLSNVIDRIDDVALRVVNSVYQTYVKERKRLSEDGVLTEEEKKIAKDMAVAELKEYMGAKGLKELKYLFMGMDSSKVEKVLGSVVEDAVVKNKLLSTLKKS